MMKALRTASLLFGTLAMVACTSAQASVDPTTLYTVDTDGSSKQVKAGEKGTFVVSIKAKGEAYVSDEAPLKLQITGKNVTPEKSTLKLADSVAKVPEGQKSQNPRFEIPFTAGTAGSGSVDAKLTFFICTKEICSRQQKDLSVPVEVQ